MQDSVFTKIIQGEIPSHKVYEDDATIAIMTIQPVRPGHVLVIPKKQVDQYIDLDDDTYQRVWATVKKVAAKIKTVTGKERVGIVVKGVDVPHFHVHLIPFDAGEGLKGGDGEPAPNEELAEMAAKLAL